MDFISLLPLDLTRIIFLEAKAYLPSIVRVCKAWKTRAYDQELYNKLISTLPMTPFGRAEWIKYMGDPGDAILLPLCIGRDIKGDGFLTLIPETLIINGKIKEVNLQRIGKLVQRYGTSFCQGAWEVPINEKWPLQKMHWVWIDKKNIGRNKTYLQQSNLCRLFGKGSDISPFLDTVVTAFMEKIRSGESSFQVDLMEGNWTRVKEKLDDSRITLGFVDDQLDVMFSDNKAYEGVFALPAMISFGRVILPAGEIRHTPFS